MLKSSVSTLFKKKKNLLPGGSGVGGSVSQLEWAKQVHILVQYIHTLLEMQRPGYGLDKCLRSSMILDIFVLPQGVKAGLVVAGSAWRDNFKPVN